MLKKLMPLTRLPQTMVGISANMSTWCGPSRSTLGEADILMLLTLLMLFHPLSQVAEPLCRHRPHTLCIQRGHLTPSMPCMVLGRVPYRTPQGCYISLYSYILGIPPPSASSDR